MNVRLIAVRGRQGASGTEKSIPVRLTAAFLAFLVPVLVAGYPTIAWPGQTRQTTVVNLADLKKIGDEAPVGRNRTDETCRLRRVQERGAQAANDANRYQRYNLFCEGWTQPSGEIRRFRARKDLPPTRLVSESGWQQDFVERLDCSEPESTTLRDGTPAALRQCKTQEGGWPVVVAAATAGARSYTFEALPTNFGLLETAYEVLEGKRGVEQSGGATGEVSAAIRRAEALIGATGKLIGVQDIGSLDTLTRLGNNQTWAGNFRGAEATFRRALEIQEHLFGRDVPSSGYVLTSLAHSVSLQGRLQEADQLFARAEPLVQKALTGDYPLHLTFRSEHETYRGKYEEAVRLGRGAVDIRLQRYGRSVPVAHSLERVALALEALGRLDEAAQVTPRYMRLTAARPVPAADLAPLLRPTEALLLALPTPNATFIFLVRDGKVHLHQAAVGGGTIRDKVKTLRTALDLGGGAPQAFDLTAAHELYQTLLAPVAKHLTGVTHLLVVPAGPLLSLPLGLLVTKPTASAAEGNYRDTAWLARDVALSVLPSVAALVDLRAVATRATAPQAFFGVGDPAFTGQRGSTRALQDALAVCRLDDGIDVDLLRGLPRLRETAQELTQIAQALGASPESSVVLGAHATKPTVTSTDLSQYRVLAFATHGLLPGELRCQAEPALALTPPATPSPGDNGLVDASDIAQLRLDADWVLLSACNAGPDGSLGSQSLSGLARAFFYAGARRLLVSHWAVASRPTVALTTGLFDQVARTPALGGAEALRRSQLTLADTPETSHPVFWAPFVLVGDGG